MGACHSEITDSLKVEIELVVLALLTISVMTASTAALVKKLHCSLERNQNLPQPELTRVHFLANSARTIFSPPLLTRKSNRITTHCPQLSILSVIACPSQLNWPDRQALLT
jgi:hypothetical protein